MSPPSPVPAAVLFVFSEVSLMLSGCASCPAVCSVPSLVSVSLAFVLGFFATGGGILTPFVTEETSRFFSEVSLASTVGLVSITALLLLLEKIKLAVLEGDFRGSIGDVGECRLRRDAGLSFDLAAVLRRMASCRFMEGEVAMAGGDFFIGETTAGWDLGRAGSEVIMTGGEVDVGEVMIRDLLMGF